MAKTLPPGTVSIPDVETPFVLNAVPDTFDERDLQYRPRLEPLPRSIDNRDQDKAFFVLLQRGNSCTGHAVAGVINTILARQKRKEQATNGRRRGRSKDDPFELARVSAYMLYYLARRYDEYEGEEDIGSSLRGAFKGWFYHGVCQEPDWPELDFEADLDEPELTRKCRESPLGAYYRINPYRLDDMQSAICELDAIAVSAAIHDGWVEPVILRNDRGDEIRVIRRSARPKILGGHAFMLVGYNQIGFLVQNSWGERWGKGGFATLPYEDWLDSAYDAWVARPGVPQTPFSSGRAQKFSGTDGALVTSKGPDLKRLAYHVVNLGNEGQLSTSGKFRSSPMQIERIFNHMERWHEAWAQQEPASKRHIVLYAHGGLVSEITALDAAQASLNWWLNNRVYPIYFAWQTGPTESILDQIFDALKAKLPSGGLGIDLEEQFDRLTEKLVRRNFTWAWDQMKQNAWAASAQLPVNAVTQWPPDQDAEKAMFRLPGASLLVSRLVRYREVHGANNIALHLVGHSAGSIFHAALLQRLVEAGIPVESITFLAPGLRADEFLRAIYPQIGTKKPVKRFTIFNLADGLELEDSCGQGGINIYHKSLLYLVSRGLERPPRSGMFETPLLGLERSLRQPARPGSSETLLDLITRERGEVIFARSQAPANRRSDATAHGAFDNDTATMTSVLLRILGKNKLEGVHAFQEHAALLDEMTLAAAMQAARQPAATVIAPAMGVEEVSFDIASSEGSIAPPRAARAPVEVAGASFSGSPIIDVLGEQGWKPIEKGKQGG